MPAGPLPARNPFAKVPVTKTRLRSPAIGASPPQDRIEALLNDFGPQLQVGEALRSAQKQRGDSDRHSSGIEAIDELLGGGFPLGELAEITGPVSSGRTSLLLALLTATTTGGGDGARGAELAALVDTPDAFDPPSAQAAGVDLRRVLWARVAGWNEAMRCTERLLETEGLPLVVLDLARSAGAGSRTRSEPAIPPSAWKRLARRAATTRTVLVVLSHQRQAGGEARVVLELEPARALFNGSPPLLEEIETRALLVRNRGGSSGRSTLIRLGGAFRSAQSPG